jgi:hypothetical protein
VRESRSLGSVRAKAEWLSYSTLLGRQRRQLLPADPHSGYAFNVLSRQQNYLSAVAWVFRQFRVHVVPGLNALRKHIGGGTMPTRIVKAIRSDTDYRGHCGEPAE